MVTLLFNPEHDLALAADELRFQPPAMALRMREELSALPAWWADDVVLYGGAAEGGIPDRVLVPVASIAQTLEWAAGRPELPEVTWTSFKDVSMASEVKKVYPWGWDKSVHNRLVQWGVSVNVMPDSGRLEEMRRLSSRALAVEALRHFRDMETEVPFCGASIFCTNEEEVHSVLQKWGNAILKCPWSGSGKGLRLAKNGGDEALGGWYRRVLQKQGGVAIEPYLNNIQDFAMEYYVHPDGKIQYEGLSVFESNNTGAYTGNRIASEAEHISYLAEKAGVVNETMQAWLQEVKEIHIKFIKEKIGVKYAGPLGIDMMLCKDGVSVAIHPCVEINLRNTMGRVALKLYQRFQVGGTFTIECASNLYERHLEDLKNPNNIPLTPIGKTNMYRAFFRKKEEG